MNLLRIAARVAILLDSPVEDLGEWQPDDETKINIKKIGKNKYQIEGILINKPVRGKIVLNPTWLPDYTTENGKELDAEQYQRLLDIFDDVDPEWSQKLNDHITNYWEQNINAV